MTLRGSREVDNGVKYARRAATPLWKHGAGTARSRIREGMILTASDSAGPSLLPWVKKG